MRSRSNFSEVSSLLNILCNRTTERSSQKIYQSGVGEAGASGIVGTCVVVCCSELQCVAVCCSVCCSVLHCKERSTRNFMNTEI